jgi:hypothetical protein
LRIPAPLRCGEGKGHPEQCGRKWLHVHENRSCSQPVPARASRDGTVGCGVPRVIRGAPASPRAPDRHVRWGRAGKTASEREFLRTRARQSCTLGSCSTDGLPTTCKRRGERSLFGPFDELDCYFTRFQC